jgi:hypothetical protein
MAALVAHVCRRSYSRTGAIPLALIARSSALLIFGMGRVESDSQAKMYGPSRPVMRRFRIVVAVVVSFMSLRAAGVFPRRTWRVLISRFTFSGCLCLDSEVE